MTLDELLDLTGDLHVRSLSGGERVQVYPSQTDPRYWALTDYVVDAQQSGAIVLRPRTGANNASNPNAPTIRGDATMIAVLFADPRGSYAGLQDVDLWDLKRDARLYQGPWPVIAHPPCARWCQLAGLVESRWGHKRGQDDGCFQSALQSVRRWGGVLEHPAHSKAWPAFGLTAPNPHGGWQRLLCGGWVCQVNQWAYGHRARKATWLYAFGVRDLPKLKWGVQHQATAVVGYSRNHRPATDTRKAITRKQGSHTPPEFRDALIAMAQSVLRPRTVP